MLDPHGFTSRAGSLFVVHVIGARFEDERAAENAMEELRTLIGNRGSVAARALGSTRYERPPSGVLVAARLPRHLAPEMLSVVERHRGQVLVAHEDQGAEVLPRPPAVSTGPAPGHDRGLPAGLPPRRAARVRKQRDGRPLRRPKPPGERRLDRERRGLRNGI